MLRLSYTDRSFSIGSHQYQKGTIAQITWEPDGNVQIRMQYPGRTYEAHFSQFKDESGEFFDTQDDLREYISQNFFFKLGGGGDFVSATDPRISNWNWAGNKLKAGNHDATLNAYQGASSPAAYSLWIGSGMLQGGQLKGYPGSGWNGTFTFGIPTLGERIKIRGFYFSSFESANQGIYTILRPSGSLGIDVPDQWYRMWTEKELSEAKLDFLKGIESGGYYKGVPRQSGTGTGTMVASNFIKAGAVVFLSLTLSFAGLTLSDNNTFNIELPFLSSYISDGFNVLHSCNISADVSVTKNSVDTIQININPKGGTSLTLELDIKYRL